MEKGDENQMKKKPNKFFKYIMDHRKLFTFIFMAFAVLLMVIPQFFVNTEWFLASTSRVEILYYCSQITSALFVIFGVIVAVWQYYLSSSKKISETNYARIEKAIELSNYYKDNILGKYSVLKVVFDKYGITEMLEKKRAFIELKDFDTIELSRLYTEDEIKKIEGIYSDPKFINILVGINQDFNIGLKGTSLIQKTPVEKGVIKAEVAINPNELFSDFYKTYVVETLNNAEYFAMAFTHKTADESVIYQSIYPTFLELCYIMYYFIAKNSNPSICKLYTNIAELYCAWRTQEKEQKEKIANSARCAAKQGTVFSDDN